MTRPVFNIEINQNATFKMSLQLTSTGSIPLDITSWSFSGSVKQNYTDADPPLVFFTASIIDVPNAVVEFSLTPYQTERLSESNYYYDFIGTNYSTTPDEVYRILEGKVKVYPGVTDSSLTDL